VRARLLPAAASFVVAATAGAQVGVAQDAEAPAGPRLVLDYSARLEADDNERLREESLGTTYGLEQRIGLAFRSETRSQTLSIDTSATGRIATDPVDDSTVTDLSQSGFDLDYARLGARSRLTFGASYRETDLIFSEPFFLDADGDTIIDEAGFTRRDGTVTNASVAASLETGIDRPLSTTYRFSAQVREFADNEDPDLFDSDTYRASITTRLKFSPVLTGRVTASYRRSDFENLENRESETESLSVGFNYAVAPTLALDASLGYSRQNELETIGGVRVEDENEGLVATLGFTRDLPRGGVFGTLTRAIQDEGFRTSLEFGRDFDLARGELAASVGVTKLDEGDLGTIFTVAYARELPDGRVSASISRRVTANTVDDENILTTAAVAYTRQVNEATSLGLDLDVARIEEVETQADDQRTEVAFTASVQRELTRDWSLDLGYRGRYNDEEGGDSAISNAVFVELGRSFLIRP
jgi:hypothetical protein